MEKWPVLTGTKKETRVCYNYRIKKYLARDYRKPKTRSESPKKIIGTEEISKTDFGSASCVSTEEKPLVSSFEEAKHKG